MLEPRYETIGAGYARTRREDPRLRDRIHAALGEARTVVNVGAGAGSYEPRDRHVIAIEPSDVMAAQRPPDLAPAIRATADDLPLRDGAVDAAMAVLTIHHWDAGLERGVRELRRVARGPVVIVTYDAAVSGAMWLMRDYLPENAAMDREIFPALDRLARWLGDDVTIEALPVPADTPDWTLGSFWAHPRRVLDADARAATSGFARMAPEVVDRVVRAVAADLDSGEWDARNGPLRALAELDVGMRLVVGRPAAGFAGGPHGQRPVMADERDSDSRDPEEIGELVDEFGDRSGPDPAREPEVEPLAQDEPIVEPARDEPDTP